MAAPGAINAGELDVRMTSNVWAAAATIVGTTIEWYDFFIFGTASALIFNKVFFPSFDPLVGTLVAFATFSVGLFARPVGAIIFGHFGDRLGRKKMLVISLLMMGLPTTLIGILPTYEQIGISAAICLVLIRVCQGIALGGEWGGAVLMAVEHAPRGRSAFFGSLPQAGCPLGLLLSSAAFALTSHLPQTEFQSWGWRLPFLASAVLIVVGVVVRRRVSESPKFSSMKLGGQIVRIPLIEVLHNHTKPVLLGIGAKLGEITLFWLMAVFILSYATGKLGLSRSDILQATMIGAAMMFILMPVCGILGDRVGKRGLFILGNGLLIVFAIPIFLTVDTGNGHMVTCAVIFALGVLYPIIYAPEASLLSELFPTSLRYTGLSLSGNIGGAVAGGFAPLVATSLLASSGNTLAVGVYLSATAVVSLLCALAMSQSRRL